MCSVTFWPLRHGFRLAMNRDEQRLRTAGLPPRNFEVGECQVIHPLEPGGGTWISLNDRGTAFALLNAYSLASTAPSHPAPRSRGDVILALRHTNSSHAATWHLRQLELERIRPFRLIGIFDLGSELIEWRWSGAHLTTQWHAPAPNAWHSSGHREVEAQQIRGDTFRRSLREPDAGSPAWLRRLHSSHLPRCGPFSVCMHREEAATVSYTEIESTRNRKSLNYHPGPLCQGLPWSDAVTFPNPNRSSRIEHPDDSFRTHEPGFREQAPNPIVPMLPLRAA